MKSGATDYVLKDMLSRLSPIVKRALKEAEACRERKRSKEALVQSEIKYRTLVEHLPAITYIATLDESSTTLYVSPQIEEILGISPVEYKADPDFWEKHLHPDDRERVMDEVHRCHESGQPFISEYRMFSKDGRLVWLSDDAVTVRDDRGNPFHRRHCGRARKVGVIRLTPWKTLC
jgi:PAS domain S-box-containing protein